MNIISTSAGSDEAAGMLAMFPSTGSNIINYTIKLKDVEEREKSVWEIAEQLRKELTDFPEIVNYNIDTGGGMSIGGNTVDVEIYGYDLESNHHALANELSEKIETIEGARDVNISREEAKPELTG